MHTHRSHASRTFVVLVVTALTLLGAAAAGATVNKSIRIGDGESAARNLSSVNGSISIGHDAHVDGEVSTVNGGIRVGSNVEMGEVTTVNGSIRVGDEVTVHGDMTTVNGSLEAGHGTVVEGNVETVNGSIELDGTTVQRDLETVNGRVTLDRGSRIQGNLIVHDVKNNNSWWGKSKPQIIELRDGSVIEGDLDVREDDREIKVILSGGSEIKGQVRGEKVTVERN